MFGADKTHNRVLREGTGNPVAFRKWINPTNEKTETSEIETEQISLIRYFNVFSVEQCDGLTHKRPAYGSRTSPSLSIRSRRSVCPGCESK